MENEKVFIEQIAVDSATPGLRGELFGVGSDGVVYRFDIVRQSWKPLPSTVNRPSR